MIGLSTIYTPQTTNAFKEKKFPEYKFLNYTDIVIGESKKLRKAGANAVLIVGHLGNDCSVGNTYGKWTEDTKQPECGVAGDEVSILIDSLPTGTIDAILQGHRHKFAHHFYKGITIFIQACPIWVQSTADTTSMSYTSSFIETPS